MLSLFHSRNGPKKGVLVQSSIEGRFYQKFAGLLVDLITVLSNRVSRGLQGSKYNTADTEHTHSA